MRAVVTADTHLDVHERYMGLGPAALAERRDQFRAAFGAVVEAALEADADLFCHCGDLFDVGDPEPETVAFVREQLARLVDAGVDPFLVVGNHDPGRGPDAPHGRFADDGLAHVFTATERPETVTVAAGGETVELSGLSFSGDLPGDADPLDGVSVPARGDWNLLLTHYGVENHLDGWLQDPVVGYDSLAALDADAVCTGHIHQRADFTVGGTRVLVPGATERRSYGDHEKETGYYRLETDGPGGALTDGYRRVEPSPMRVERAAFDADVDAGEVAAWVRERSEPGQTFRATVEVPASVDLSAARRAGEAANLDFALERDDE